VYFIGAAFGDGGFSGEVMWTLVDGTLKEQELFHSVKFIEFIKRILEDVYRIKKFTKSCDIVSFEAAYDPKDNKIAVLAGMQMYYCGFFFPKDTKSSQ